MNGGDEEPDAGLRRLGTANPSDPAHMEGKWPCISPSRLGSLSLGLEFVSAWAGNLALEGERGVLYS